MTKSQQALIIAGLMQGWGEQFPNSDEMIYRSAVSYFIADKTFRKLTEDINNSLLNK